MIERKRMEAQIFFNLSNSFSLGNALPIEYGLTFKAVTNAWVFFLDIYFLKYA